MVHLRRAAPPDGVVRDATVWQGRRRVGRVRYGWDAQHLVVEGVDVGPEAVGATMASLLAPFPGGVPSRLTQTGVADAALVRWYRSSPLAPGLVVTGQVGGVHRPYDPIGCLGDDELTAPLDLTLVYDAALVAVGGPAAPDLAQVGRWFADPNPLVRIAAVRRLGFDRSLPEPLVRAAHALALVNDGSGVRQFAAVHLSGFAPQPRADVDELLGWFADPCAAWERYGVARAPSPGWSAERARRDARYAVAWIFANLARDVAAPGRAALLAELDRRLPSDADEAEARRRALDELSPARRFGFGGEEPVHLTDWVRFAVLRDRLLRQLGLADQDAFGWLARDAALLAAHLPSVAEVARAPSAPFELDDPPATLPPWIPRLFLAG